MHGEDCTPFGAALLISSLSLHINFLYAQGRSGPLIRLSLHVLVTAQLLFFIVAQILTVLAY